MFNQIKPTVKPLNLCLLMILGIIYSYGQNKVTDSSVTCISYWKKNDVKNLLITQTDETWNAGKREKNNIANYAATITIIDSNKTGYIIEWRNKPSVDNNNEKDTASKAIADPFINLKTVYKTDELGTFDSLVNYDEIRQFVEESIGQLRNSTADKENFDKSISTIRSLLNSRESIESLILKDIRIFHSPYGTKYALTKNQYPVQISNPFGQEPFPAILSEYLINLKKGDDLATVAFDQEIDQKEATQIIKDILKKFDQTNVNSTNRSDFSNYISISDHYEYDFILSSGWIKRVYFKREVKLDQVKKIETREIVVN